MQTHARATRDLACQYSCVAYAVCMCKYCVCGSACKHATCQQCVHTLLTEGRCLSSQSGRRLVYAMHDKVVSIKHVLRPCAPGLTSCSMPQAPASDGQPHVVIRPELLLVQQQQVQCMSQVCNVGCVQSSAKLERGGVAQVLCHQVQ